MSPAQVRHLRGRYPKAALQVADRRLTRQQKDRKIGVRSPGGTAATVEDMSEKLPLEIDDPIQVKAVHDDSSLPWESRVLEIAADELLIEWPRESGDRVGVGDRQMLTISFIRNQAFFEFEAIVLDRIDDPIALLAIRPTSPLRCIQRRQDLRISVPAPVELRAKVVKLENFRLAGSEIRRISSETTSLSAGGFSIQYHSPVHPGTLFEVRLTLPGEHRQPLALGAQVVRCAALGAPGTPPSLFELGFAFTRISEPSRARILRFVIGAEREKAGEA